MENGEWRMENGRMGEWELEDGGWRIWNEMMISKHSHKGALTLTVADPEKRTKS